MVSPEIKLNIENKIKELKAGLTGILYEDNGTLATIRNLETKLGIVKEFEDDDNCLYCGS